MTTVRLMSYNVRAFKDDRAALERVVRAYAPDVLCLQEAPRHPWSGPRIASFASACGLIWPGGAGRGLMSTTLAVGPRLEVVDSGHRHFPVGWRDEPRGWAYARVRIPGGDAAFTAVSIHLSLRRSEHLHHARALRLDWRTAGNLVIAGDINEDAKGPAWKRLSQGLEDAAGPGCTFPAGSPVKRIDAVFSSPGLSAAPVECPADTADVARASDHCPLAVDVELD